MGDITTVIALIAILITLFYLIEYLINKFREINIVKNIPGPKAYPIIGNLNMFLGDSSDITRKILESSAMYSSPWRVWLGPHLFIVFDDPEDWKIILNKYPDLEKNQSYDFLKLYVGNGLITAPVSIWKNHHKILNSAFKKQTFSIYTDKIVKHSIRLNEILETNNGKNIDVLHYVHLCTLDLIYDALFENDFNLQNDPKNKHQEYIIETIDLLMQRITKFWLHPDVIFRYSSIGKRLKYLISHHDNITYEIIKKKKKSIEEGKIHRKSKELNEEEERYSFLDILLTLFYEKGEISEKYLRDEINTILIAGSETSAATLSFLFLMLASFPDIQNRVYEELYDIYGSSDPKDFPIKYNNIAKMEYLDRVVKETLRLFPTAPFIGRTASTDIKVNENFVVPKNSSMIFFTLISHRKKKYWTEPLRFNPDRFLEGNYNVNCYLPFGSGKRSCLGKKLAMIQMKAIAANLLRKFIVKIDHPVSVEDVKLKIHVTLNTKEPIYLRFYKR